MKYRYNRIGQLPPSRPVQMWFGRFIHGILEEAFRRYQLARHAGRDEPPPWPDEIIEEICELITRRLAAENLFPWNEELQELGNARAKLAINELGPSLFPLIHRAEVRLTGTRDLPLAQIPQNLRFREADRYEVVGVIDVITHIQLNDPNLQDNLLLQWIREELPEDLPDEFEVIVDYKGMRRPRVEASSAGAPSYWDVYAWQVQTYAHLRSRHEDSPPVVAGIVLYLNELLPTQGDLRKIREDIRAGCTDVVPASGSASERWLNAQKVNRIDPHLPRDFRLQRTVRVVPITEESIGEALSQFDEVVARIEVCRGSELSSGRLLTTWEKNPADESTCAACDARTFCPDNPRDTEPRLPAVRAS